MDPLGTPLHGCVEYQAGTLPASATGAVKALPCAAAPVCSGQVHHDHDPWPGRTKKNKKQATRRQDKKQWVLEMGKSGHTADLSIKDQELLQWLQARAAKSGNTAALSSETKADIIQETTTNEANVIVTRANEAKMDEFRMDQTGINEAMLVGIAVIEVETGEIEMEGGYARAAKVDIIRGKEVNMHNIVVDEVMAITDVLPLWLPTAVRRLWILSNQNLLALRVGSGGTQDFEHDPIEVLDNN